MNTLLDTYFDQRTNKEGPKTLLVPWLDHPGRALDKEIDAMIDVASTESADVTPKNGDSTNSTQPAARKSSTFDRAVNATNINEEKKSEEIKSAET
jgi:hypothetical protein